MYLVSILVPVYGVEKYIERCARSLFEQTYDNLEYIFVDDCSPDNSIAILKRVMEDYPERKEQVRIIRHERNRGLAAARNTALDAAQGSFLSHVDSDDYLDRDAIRLLVEKQVETGADIVSGNYYAIKPTGIKKMFEPDYSDQHEMMQRVISPVFAHYAIWHRLIKLSLYNNHHIRALERVDYNEDLQQFVPLVYYAKTVAKINECIYYYDCTNMDSYESTLLYNEQSWYQVVESVLFVDDFLADKEPEYQHLSHQASIRFFKLRMSLAAKCGKRDCFEVMKRIILSQYANYYDTVGWGTSIVRAFMCNFTLNSIFRRSYAFCQQLLIPMRRK